MTDEQEKELLGAIAKLLVSITTDNNEHGGLLTRDTIRAADELRTLFTEDPSQ